MRIALAATLLAAAWLAAPMTHAAGKPKPAASRATMFKGVSRAAMLTAAKDAPLKLIDYDQTYCDGETYVVNWLTQLTSVDAARIDWTTGPCNLTNTLNPLDGGGAYCVDATIHLKHPKNRQDVPVIEIYLNDPKPPKPGPAYAFRDMFDEGDGLDYERDRQTFQTQWRARFKDAPPPPCSDEQ